MFRRQFAYKMYAGLLSLAAWVVPASAVPVFQIQGIGPAGFASSATAINAAGAVVGNYVLANGSNQAFFWKDGITTYQTLPAGASQNWVSAISGAGQSGGFADTAQGPQGTVWDHFGAVSLSTGAYIMGMNATGDMAGMMITPDGAGAAFVQRNGTLTSLGQPGGGDWSSAYAINGVGTAAGTTRTGSGMVRAFKSARAREDSRMACGRPWGWPSPSWRAPRRTTRCRSSTRLRRSSRPRRNSNQVGLALRAHRSSRG